MAREATCSLVHQEVTACGATRPNWSRVLSEYCLVRVHEEVTAGAVKRRLAHQIADEMQIHKITKSEMARRMKTSRTQLDRLLDPQKTKVQLETIYKAARAVGRQVKMEFV